MSWVESYICTRHFLYVFGQHQANSGTALLDSDVTLACDVFASSSETVVDDGISTQLHWLPPSHVFELPS